MSTAEPIRPDLALDLEAANQELDGASPEDIVAWAAARFGGRLALSTSFGATSAVMLHLVAKVAPATKVICIDTGYLFPETYRFADELTRKLGLDVRWYSARVTGPRQEALYGKLWEQGPEGVQRYLQLNKVEPMERALEELGVTAWMAGLRREQTEHRRALRTVVLQNGRIKVHPILALTEAETEAYMAKHELPLHPLVAEGYRSIGDHHSTLPTTPDMDPRDGRILGQARECGLHLPLSEGQSKSYKSSSL
jgi:phosphoadenosine phosphosulfate reductase